jgi:hypothetical protein
MPGASTGNLWITAENLYGRAGCLGMGEMQNEVSPFTITEKREFLNKYLSPSLSASRYVRDEQILHHRVETAVHVSMDKTC